jgi:hypothetical protein
MFENYLETKLFEMVQREGLDMNDPMVFKKVATKRQQIIMSINGVIDQLTARCDCGRKKTIEKPEMETA